MREYKKLVKFLRWCSSVHDASCVGCLYENSSDMACDNRLMHDAADAMEALQSEEPTEKQVVDYCHKRCLVVIAADLFHELKASYGRTPKRGELKNADKIRAMTDEELAEWVTSEGRYFGEEYEGYMSCLDWLKEEVQE